MSLHSEYIINFRLHFQFYLSNAACKPDKQKEFLMNSLRLLYERFFHESNHKEFLWTSLSDLECPIGADSLSINKEFFMVIFFVKLITQKTF